MNESLEILKYISSGAPEGATHHYFMCSDEYNISNYIDMDNCNWWDSTLCEWKSWGGVADSRIRSLSDIKRIIELMKLNQDMHSAVAGYLSGKEWSRWDEFNKGKFKI